MYSIFPCIAIVHHYGCSALSKLLGSLCFRFCQGALMLAAAIDDADLVETLVGAGAEVFGLLRETGVGYNIFGALDMRIRGQQHYQNAGAESIHAGLKSWIGMFHQTNLALGNGFNCAGSFGQISSISRSISREGHSLPPALLEVRLRPIWWFLRQF